MSSGCESICDKCPAICCHYITIEIDKPSGKRQHDDVRWYLLHEGITLLIEKGRYMIKAPTPCRELTPENRCGIYEKRPKTCRDYSTDNCDYHSEFGDWETEYVELESPEAYDAYRESKKRKKKLKKKKADSN
jgi:uncharacterized protein